MEVEEMLAEVKLLKHDEEVPIGRPGVENLRMTFASCSLSRSARVIFTRFSVVISQFLVYYFMTLYYYTTSTTIV